ncbi:unnamed protein product, partial [Oppiella nova]
MAAFFTGSCVPGAADARVNSNGSGVDSLCSQCIGDDNGSHVCDMSAAERFSGEEGAFRCLVEGRGDVAFVSHKTALKLTDGKSEQKWAKELRSVDFRLLCRNQNRSQNVLTNNGINDFNTIPNPNSVHNSQRFRLNSYLAPITDYQSCHIARIPAPIVATSSQTPEELRFEVLQLVTALSDTFTNKVPQSFRLFGEYRNQSDLIFSDNTNRIESLPPETTYADALAHFLPLLEDNDPIACANEAQHLWPSIATIIVSIFCIPFVFK